MYSDWRVSSLEEGDIFLGNIFNLVVSKNGLNDMSQSQTSKSNFLLDSILILVNILIR